MEQKQLDPRHKFNAQREHERIALLRETLTARFGKKEELTDEERKFLKSIRQHDVK